MELIVIIVVVVVLVSGRQLMRPLLYHLSVCRRLPAYSSCEVIALFGSLSTCDPGDIKDTVQVSDCCSSLQYTT